MKSRAAYQQSYSYRKILEPSALLEDSFELNPADARRFRTEHQALLDKDEITIAEIFEVNARFHLGLAKCSGNRFIVEAISQQNRLRRFVEYSYNWRSNPDIIQRVCKEHMDILDALEEGNIKLASNLMWHHLDRASRIQKSDNSGTVKAWAEN